MIDIIKNYINLSTKMDLGLLTVNLCKNIIKLLQIMKNSINVS